MIETAWPDLTVLARGAGEIDPYDRRNAPLFRGEEAFAPEVTGWRRWSKPSPEPRLDEPFRALLRASIVRESGAVAGLVARLADRVARTLDRPPLLVAILRAGVPVGALLADALARRCGARVPLVALSLFDGLGWDTLALDAALKAHPGHPVWFVDGWTSGGGVARELRASHARWLNSGRPDFTGGAGPRLAVLCDPRAMATAAAIHADRFVPSACFTAPETLGFSRGFATGDEGMFRVYGYPRALVRPDLLGAWTAIARSSPSPPAPVVAPAPGPAPPPDGWRIHSNEVIRALINRAPREVVFRDDEVTVAAEMAPVLHLCRLREVPVRFGQAEIAAWGALAAARMGGPAP